MSGDIPRIIGDGIAHAQQRHQESRRARRLDSFPIVADLIDFSVYCFDLTFRLIPWFRFWWWTVQLGLRTCVWATMLLPVLLSYAVAYFTDPRICRRIRYGKTPREFLDVYVPPQASLAQQGQGPKVPVVVSLMGGGFVIGHRSYNVQLGLRCAEAGVIFVCIDYRNFPFAQIPDMVENVSRGVRWVFQNIESFGGDLDNMVFAGQSAGAHLGAAALVEHCLLEAKHMQGVEGLKQSEAFDVWSTKQFKAYVGISGPYDILRMSPSIGLPPRAVDWLTMSDPDSCSPGFLVSSEEWKQVSKCAVDHLPPIHLFHGGDDDLVPSSASVEFAEQLWAAGASCTLDVRPGINHTYPVIEGPMVRHDIQIEIILPILLGAEGAAAALERMRGKPMWPRCVVRLASRLSPFGGVSREYM